MFLPRLSSSIFDIEECVAGRFGRDDSTGCAVRVGADTPTAGSLPALGNSTPRLAGARPTSQAEPEVPQVGSNLVLSDGNAHLVPLKVKPNKIELYPASQNLGFISVPTWNIQRGRRHLLWWPA